MTSYTYDAIVMAAVLVSLLALLVGLVVQYVRAARSQRDRLTDHQLRIGLRLLQRAGRLNW